MSTLNRSAAELTNVITGALDTIEDWRERQLSLDAGFGLVGGVVGRTFRPWLYSLSSDYYPGERVHVNCDAFDDIENLAVDLAKELYHAKYVDLHTLSAGSGTSVVICALTEKGDTIMSMPDPLGHRSMRTDGIGEFLDRRYVPLPIDRDKLIVNLEQFEKEALAHRPKLIMLGSALYLYNEPFREIQNVADRIGAIVAVDVSHTYGLLPCSMGVNPLDEGADLIVGSTYKTVCGPNKGMICTNSDTIRQKIHDTALRMVFNYNAFLIPALAQALIELKFHGEEYGCQLIKNAKALAKAMDDLGFDMVGADRDYTDTHLLAAKMEGNKPRELIKKLAEANILCSTVPCDSGSYYLRPATLVLTRRGFTEKDMPMVAKMLADVIYENKTEAVKAQVLELMRDPDRHVVHFAQP